MTPPPDRDPLADLPWPAPAEPSERVSAAIRERCTSDLRSQRGMSCTSRGLLSLGLSAAMIAWLGYWAWDRQPQSELMEAGLAGAAGWGLVQAGVLYFCLARPPGRRISRRMRLGLLLLVPLSFFAYLGFTSSGAVPFEVFSSSAHATHALRCTVLTLVFGGLVAAGGFLVWRRTDPLQPRLSGALLGLVGGLGGSLAMGIACASHETYHLWFSHGLAILGLALLGWLCGRKLLAP
jgi:hypothetical protein